MQPKKNDKEKAKLLRLMRGEGFGVYIQIWHSHLTIFTGLFDISIIKNRSSDLTMAYKSFYWLEHDQKSFIEWWNNNEELKRRNITSQIYHRSEEHKYFGFKKVDRKNSFFRKMRVRDGYRAGSYIIIDKRCR